MSGVKALLVFSILIVAVVLLNGVARSDQPATGSPATNPAASKPTATQPAYPLWDGKESVGDYAKRAGIKDIEITLDLDGNVTMKLVLIPAGKFLMGSPDNEKDRGSDEGPQREVTITKSFHMGVCPVTQEQFEAVMGTNPSKFKGAANPVSSVSWNDSVEFCRKLAQRTGRKVRLPTEAEWEYACRAGSQSRFFFGDDDKSLGDYGWYWDNSAGVTHPVGQKKSNAFGLYDMHGNVWQWCSDYYVDSYEKAPDKDPEVSKAGDYRVLRGGSWNYRAAGCRCAVRTARPANDRTSTVISFRVVVASN